MADLHSLIIESLDSLSPDKGDLFNKSVIDLLREEFPGIAAVEGGQDAGMDGAIPVPDGEPYPLVCTIQENVIENVRDSLNANLKHRPTATKKALVVTSQRLSNPRRRNIEDRVREKGYEPVNVLDRVDVANRLYYSRRWLKELLGLTGEPDVLSKMPSTYRPWMNLCLVGREDDLDSLRESIGDVVLTGQPGSGKSFLLHQLAQEDWGLFAVSEDANKLFAAARDLRPSRIIVDDAHLRGDLLTELVRLRRETEADFQIVASCWPGSETEIKDVLEPANRRVHSLELMIRREIQSIYQALGLNLQGEAMRWLIDQAANRPGLAVSLGAACLAGDWFEVRDGERLRSVIVRSLNRNCPKNGNYDALLACIALGNGGGMRLESVTDFLGDTRAEIQRMIRFMAAGGIIEQVVRDDQKFLVVQPMALRPALIRDVFFSGQPGDLDVESLLEEVPSVPNAVECIVESFLSGASVSETRLREWVTSFGSDSAWRNLALSDSHCHWVLENYPRDLSEIAGALLHKLPIEALIRLVGAALEEDEPERRSEILEPIRVWLKDSIDFGLSPPERSRRMVEVAIQENQPPRRLAIGQLMLAWAFDPGFEASTVDPASGGTVSYRRGFMPLDLIPEIQKLWEESFFYLSDLSDQAWPDLRSMVEEWFNPMSVAMGSVDSDSIEAARALGTAMVSNLLSLQQPKALRILLERFARRIGIEVCSREESPFTLLFPATSMSLSRDETEKSLFQAKIYALAEEWSTQDSATVANQLAGIESDAYRFRFPLRETPTLMKRVAEIVDSPLDWIEAITSQALPADLIEPLVKQVGLEGRAELLEAVDRCLQSPAYEWIAIQAIATMLSPRPSHWAFLEEKAPQNLRALSVLTMSRQIPNPSLWSLLEHNDDQVRLAIAAGLWSHEPEKRIPEELELPWRRAIIKSTPRWIESSFYEVDGIRSTLPGILASDPSLAFSWFEERIRRNDLNSYYHETRPSPSMDAAISVLSADQRFDLLRLAIDDPEYPRESMSSSSDSRYQPRRLTKKVVNFLVNRDTVIYSRLVAVEGKTDAFLGPLAGPPDLVWKGLATTALGAGFPKTEVVNATMNATGLHIVGEQFAGWREKFEDLKLGCSCDLLEVIKICEDRITEDEEKGEASRKQRELTGWV